MNLKNINEKAGPWDTRYRPKTLTFRLKEEDLQEIVVIIDYDKYPEVRQQAMGLRLRHEGQSPNAVAKFMFVSPSTAFDWHHARK